MGDRTNKAYCMKLEIETTVFVDFNSYVNQFWPVDRRR